MSVNISNPIVMAENNMLAFWRANNVRERYFSWFIPRTDYVSGLFLVGNGLDYHVRDGPPFATGTPHYGHILAGSLKDTKIRYKRLSGYNINLTPGFDVHGVPIEMQVSERLNIRSKRDINDIGRFCDECRNIVMVCANEWRSSMERFGRWAKFENPYKTMDLDFMNKVWEMFYLLYVNNHIKTGYRIAGYSTELETQLSNFEASSNYKNRTDNSLTFCVELIDYEIDGMKCYLSVFTTTPWTLPGNCVLAINSNLDYVGYIKPFRSCALEGGASSGANVIVFKVKTADAVDYYVEKKGMEFVGRGYLELFPDLTQRFYGTVPDGFHRVYHADFVDNSGTGVVHIAPMFGENDFVLCVAIGVVDNTGKNLYDYLTSKGELNMMVGQFFDVNYELTLCYRYNTRIIAYIETYMPMNFMEKKAIDHNYPHCWRTDTPLIYRARQSITVDVSNFKDELLELNRQINWFPMNIGSGQFSIWLENARDWNISRDRYWGTPIPMWREVDGTDVIVVKNSFELEEYCGVALDSVRDLHRDKIDNMEIVRNGKRYRRIDAVLDCWFDSGCVPSYFSGNEFIQSDFIAEGLDQTRGWFYTSLVIGYIHSRYKNGLALPSFKNVVVNGIVLASDKKKMSKRLGNYPDPNKLINECGADALRMYLLSSPAARGVEMAFRKEEVHEIARDTMIPYNNAINFLTMYKRVYNVQSVSIPDFTRVVHRLNKWILYKTYILERHVHSAYECNNFTNVVVLLTKFVEVLNNAYIALMRSNFKTGGHKAGSIAGNNEIIESINTLNFVLLRLAYLFAPIAPFFAENIYSIVGDGNVSIHLTQYWDFYDKFIDQYENTNYLPNEIDAQLEFLGNVRQLRAKNNHPKSKTLKNLVCMSNSITEATILEEIKIECATANFTTRGYDSEMVRRTPVFDDREMGRKFRAHKNNVQRQILSNPQLINSLANNETIVININGENYVCHHEVDKIVKEWRYDLVRNDAVPADHVMHVGFDCIIFADIRHSPEDDDILCLQNLARQYQRARGLAGLIQSDPVVLYLILDDDARVIADIYGRHADAFDNYTGKRLEFLDEMPQDYLLERWCELSYRENEMRLHIVLKN